MTFELSTWFTYISTTNTSNDTSHSAQDIPLRNSAKSHLTRKSVVGVLAGLNKRSQFMNKNLLTRQYTLANLTTLLPHRVRAVLDEAARIPPNFYESFQLKYLLKKDLKFDWERCDQTNKRIESTIRIQTTPKKEEQNATARKLCRRRKSLHKRYYH